MTTAYYDSTYLFKLQCDEAGSPEVRAHASTVGVIYSAVHGRAEYASAAFRKVREGFATAADFRLALAQLHADTATGNLQFLPITEDILARVESVFASAPSTTYLRAADALHLATATAHGFAEIYSNDKHLLAAARIFGLSGVNVIA